MKFSTIKITKIFLILFFLGFIFTQNVKNIIKNELDCDENPLYKQLEIRTNFNENSDDYNIIVMKECKVQENWKIKQDSSQSCVIPERVFEGEDNIRRSFRFNYNNDDGFKDKIVISSIALNYDKSLADPELTMNSLTLSPGESIDVYIDYDCKDMKDAYFSSSNWYKIKFDIEFGNGKYKSFEYIKICTANYSESLDFSHFVIIGLIFLVIFASVKDYLKSKVEGTIVEKFTEIKNPENLFIMGVVISLLLIFLGVVDLFDKWVFLCILVVGPLSVAMIAEGLMRKYEILTNLENKTFEIPYLGSITMYFVVCLAIGGFVLFLWIETHNWIINNVLSISIAIITIRLFKFTSFKFIISIYILSFVFEYLWVYYKANVYTENYKLTNQSRENLPVRLLCPELLSSPFSSCNSLPIADIILPGILLSYSKKFDESKYIQNYFYVGIGSLASGLIINIIVYYYKMTPTPSFLFTGPIILIATLIVAYKRLELYEFIEGFSSTIYENRLEKNLREMADQENRKVDSKYNPPSSEMKIIEDNLSNNEENERKFT